LPVQIVHLRFTIAHQQNSSVLTYNNLSGAFINSIEYKPDNFKYNG